MGSCFAVRSISFEGMSRTDEKDGSGRAVEVLAIWFGFLLEEDLVIGIQCFGWCVWLLHFGEVIADKVDDSIKVDIVASHSR
jgi:hypothetical protein